LNRRISSITVELQLTEAGSRDTGPGPGAYAPEKTPRKGGISMGWRWDSNDEERSPGPAHYKVDSTGGTSPRGPAWSLAGRYSNSLDDTGPGPGQYMPDYNPTARRDPAWSLSGRHQVNTDENSPGPGAYNPNSRKRGQYYGDYKLDCSRDFLYSALHTECVSTRCVNQTRVNKSIYATAMKHVTY